MIQKKVKGQYDLGRSLLRQAKWIPFDRLATFFSASEVSTNCASSIPDEDVNKAASTMVFETYDQQLKSVKEGLIGDEEGSSIALEGEYSRICRPIRTNVKIPLIFWKKNDENDTRPTWNKVVSDWRPSPKCILKPLPLTCVMQFGAVVYNLKRGIPSKEKLCSFYHDEEYRARYAAAMDAVSRGLALKRNRIAQQGSMVKGSGSSQNRGSFVAFKGQPAAKNAKEEEALKEIRVEIKNFSPGWSKTQNDF